MPLKEFICTTCGSKFEKLTKTGLIKEKCPKCGNECNINYNGKCSINGKGNCSGKCSSCGGCKH